MTVRYVPGMPSDGVMPTYFWAVMGLFACVFGGAFVLIAFTVGAG